jgi:hypothetical protein
MPYTMARLDQALRLFRRFKPRLVRHGLPHKYLEDCIQSKYDLRVRERYQNIVLGFVDDSSDDGDSDYDPREVLRKKRSAPISSAQGRPPKRQKANDSSAIRQQVSPLLVTIKLSSAAGKALLLNFASSVGGPSKPSHLPTVLSLEGYSLRNRDIIRNPSTGQKPSKFRNTQSLLSLDPGDPAARECKSCWEFNQQCSLLDRPLFYPCQVCREEHVDCDLIIPPRQKRGCENCERTGFFCSYDEEVKDHHLPCQQCQKTKLQCIAGPSADETQEQGPKDISELQPRDAPATDLSFSPITPIFQPAPFSQPSQPQTNSINTLRPLPFSANSLCSKASHPTKRIKTSNQRLKECQARLESMLSKPWDPNDLAPVAPEPAQRPLSELQFPKTFKGKQGRTRIITTWFAHPVNFAYEPPDDGSKPCHWCNDFTYGILGLGKVEVEVIEYKDEDGLVEIDGGHVGKGHDPSRMCTLCALERIHIVNCRGHTISALHGYDPIKFDYDAAFDSLAAPPADSSDSNDQSSSRGPKQINPWCMLCPNPAFFGCTTIQKTDKFQELVPASSPSAMGCGLLLCANCARLMQTCQASISQVVSKIKEQDGEDGVRADVIYLLPANDLYQFYCRPASMKTPGSR